MFLWALIPKITLILHASWYNFLTQNGANTFILSVQNLGILKVIMWRSESLLFPCTTTNTSDNGDEVIKIGVGTYTQLNRFSRKLLEDKKTEMTYFAFKGKQLLLFYVTNEFTNKLSMSPRLLFLWSKQVEQISLHTRPIDRLRFHWPHVHTHHSQR